MADSPTKPEQTISKDRPTQERPPTITTFEQSLHIGPLPPAEVLEGYENVLPGAAERIFTMRRKSKTMRIKWIA